MNVTQPREAPRGPSEISKGHGNVLPLVLHAGVLSSVQDVIERSSGLDEKLRARVDNATAQGWLDRVICETGEVADALDERGEGEQATASGRGSMYNDEKGLQHRACK